MLVVLCPEHSLGLIWVVESFQIKSYMILQETSVSKKNCHVIDW